MIFKKDPAAAESELLAFRRQIDDIDDQLFALLKERIAIVTRVGEYKRRTAPGRCPIRPAREAEMIRRVIGSFEDSTFPPAAAAALWRIIIGASTSVEANLTLSVFAPERDNDYVWMAREYFGPFVPITRQGHIKRVIGDVMDGKTAVGIVPMLRSADTTFWWTNLVHAGNDAPRVFARIPFVYSGAPSRGTPSALAISRLNPEPSGDDSTLLVLEADHNVSQTKLQTTFTNARLDASWINIATLSPSARHHLIEVKGFVTLDNPSIDVLKHSLGSSLYHLSFLGAYANPVIIHNGRPNHDSRPLHVAFSGK
jgi:chorismate mutase/prephenate dehydratase